MNPFAWFARFEYIAKWFDHFLEHYWKAYACRLQQLVTPCPCTRATDGSSHTDDQSILLLASLANTRAGLTCANQDTWLVIMPYQSKASSRHRATWHAWTRTPSRNMPSSQLDLGDRDMAGGCLIPLLACLLTPLLNVTTFGQVPCKTTPELPC